MQNGRQIDLSAQVDRVKRRTRPWKSIIALLLAIAAAVISHRARRGRSTFSTTSDLTNQFIIYGTAVLFLVFGSTATYGLAGKSRELLEPTTGMAHSAIVRYVILIVGAFTTLAVTLVLFGVNVSQLILGGALTTVFLSIAAQQALGNVFAGLVLVFARPFKVGDAIQMRAGALGGTIDGIVTDIGITYVRVNTDGTMKSIPNSQVLNAIVGPIPPEEPKEGPPAEENPRRRKNRRPAPTASRARRAARSDRSPGRPGPSDADHIHRGPQRPSEADSSHICTASHAVEALHAIAIRHQCHIGVHLTTAMSHRRGQIRVRLGCCWGRCDKYAFVRKMYWLRRAEQRTGSEG